MTHLKKSLAMLLALIMMFSSMSVAANAWSPSDDPSDITFTVKFFRESPKDSGNWIQTENAAPGDTVKARVFVKTGFATSGGESCLVFDTEYFSGVGLVNNEPMTVSTNPNYAGPADDDYDAGEYGLEGKAAWKDSAHYSEWIEKYDWDYILSLVGKDYFKTHDLIQHSIVYENTVLNSKLDDSDWMYEFEFVVNNNEKTTTVDSTGEILVPPFYNSPDRDYDMPIDIIKGKEGENRVSSKFNKSMIFWHADFTPNPGTLTTTSKIIFDLDLGILEEDGSYSEDNIYTVEKGIIGKEADLTSISNPTHPEGKEFKYWTDKKPVEGETPQEVTTVNFDYNDVTLYAVWGEPSGVDYTLKKFYMNADGTYPEDVEGTTESAQAGDKVSAPESTDERFTLDETRSDFEVEINADGSSVVNAYYERNKYNVVYHYEDMTGETTDTYSARFGAELPAFNASGSDEPARTGYTFVGWTTTEGGTEPETLPLVMPAEDLHLYAIFVPGETYDFEFIFDAKEGAFSDGEKLKRYSYLYLEETVKPEEPTAPGKRFVGWDVEVPELAEDDMYFEAIYEDIEYTVTFKADTDEDGTYETTVSELVFTYGEKLYPEHAPESYPADVWKLEDGTAVQFVNDEEKAFEITEDIVLYTVGSDEYPANFYWSEDDLNNGEEPYKTVYVKYDTEIPVPDAPEKDGYNFIAWIPDVESGLIMDSHDGMDFYAEFEAKDITVTYDPNGGDCTVSSDTVKYEKSVTLPEASRDGYELLGWVTPEGENVGKAGESYAVPTENITLKADWDAEEHTITFVDEDGKELGKITADTDEEIETPENLNPPVKEGHKFTGWTADGVTGTVNVPATMPADDMVLKATWEKLSYDFSANANGGKFDNEEDKISGKILYGEPLNVEQPDWTGHEFLGWAKADDESNTIITLPATMPAEALNIKAVWKTNKHDVYYDALGGIFTEEEGTPGFLVYKNIEYGKEIPVPANNPEKDGYEFIRWTPEAPEVMPDNELRFTAVWEKIPEPTEVEYKIFISYPNPANPEETITKTVITDSALPGTTVGVIEEGETATTDKVHTYEEILANVTVDGIEPNYDNKPETMTVTPNGGEIVVEFKLTKYTVEFNPNGGKFGESDDSVIATGTWGQAVNAPANPTMEGYNFTGWDKTAPETFTEDVVINATWAIQKHNAIFVVVDENGNEVDRIPVEYEYGKAITAPDYTPDAGYEFNGWDIPAGTTMGEKDVTFTSTLEPIYYSVSYEISGLPADKNVEAPAAQTGIRYGEPADVAAAPEVEGYIFDGWYDGRVKYDAEGEDKIDSVEKNITLTGTYTAKEFTITYDTDGAGTIAPEKYDCDEVVSTLPTVSKDGYKFLGWYDGGTKVEAGFKMPANDINLTAKWEKIIVYSIITLDANGGKFSNGAPVYPVRSKVGDPFNAVPANPTRDGFEFIGWVDENGNATSIPAIFPEKDVTLKAKWAELYDVTYYEEDGTTVIKTFVDAGKEGTALPAIDDPVKEGWHFTGWVDKDGNKVTAIPAGNLDLFATFEENDPTEFTITYKDNGAVINTVTYAVDAPIAEYAPAEVVGKTFKGWSPALPEKMPAENLTVEAVWETNKHSFTLDANGGTFEGGKTEFSETFEYGTDLSDKLPANPTREGYEFAGWDGTLPSTMPDKEVSLKAKWTPVGPETHKVEYFYAVDGEVYQTLTFEEGKPIVHPADPNVDGLTFVEWVDKDGNAIPDDLVMGTEDLKIYAKFDVNKYKVTYIVDGEVYEAYDVLYQAEVPVPEDPADSPERVFAGWDPNPEAVMPAHDLTYTAKWADPEPDKYTATFLRADGNTHSKQVLAEGDVIEIPEAPKKFGYVFVGWEPEVPEVMPAQDMVFEPQYEVDKTFVTIVVGGTVIAGGAIAASIANAAIITGASIIGGVIVLVGVAELVKHTHTVTFIVDGETYKTYKLVEGMKIPVPADPVKDGFTFEGWNPEVPEKMGKEDLVFEAVWAEISDDNSSDIDVEIPETGSVAGGLAAFAAISGAAAAAYVITRRKKED